MFLCPRFCSCWASWLLGCFIFFASWRPMSVLSRSSSNLHTSFTESFSLPMSTGLKFCVLGHCLFSWVTYCRHYSLKHLGTSHFIYLTFWVPSLLKFLWVNMSFSIGIRRARALEPYTQVEILVPWLRALWVEAVFSNHSGSVSSPVL